MPSPSWEFRHPTRFTAGATGRPGARVFYLQVFADGSEIDLKCEKQQVTMLADQLLRLLADLPDAESPGTVAATEALPPGELLWVVGSISIGVDHSEDRIVVLLEEMILDEDDGSLTTGPGSLRLHLSTEQVRGFAAQAAVLASAGRPTSRLCGQPVDPDGHACPRLN